MLLPFRFEPAVEKLLPGVILPDQIGHSLLRLLTRDVVILAFRLHPVAHILIHFKARVNQLKLFPLVENGDAETYEVVMLHLVAVSQLVQLISEKVKLLSTVKIAKAEHIRIDTLNMLLDQEGSMGPRDELLRNNRVKEGLRSPV